MSELNKIKSWVTSSSTLKMFVVNTTVLFIYEVWGFELAVLLALMIIMDMLAEGIHRRLRDNDT